MLLRPRPLRPLVAALPGCGGAGELSTAPTPLVPRSALPPSPLQSRLAASQPPLGSGSWPELSRAVPRCDAGDCELAGIRAVPGIAAAARPVGDRVPAPRNVAGPARLIVWGQLCTPGSVSPPRPPRQGAGRSPGCQQCLRQPHLCPQSPKATEGLFPGPLCCRRGTGDAPAQPPGPRCLLLYQKPQRCPTERDKKGNHTNRFVASLPKTR